MQYIEGVFLVSESVRRQLDNGAENINITFVLPNDEGKYYLDFPDEIGEVLKYMFGDKLNGININISFQFFLYGSLPTERPYIDKEKKAAKVNPKDISLYLTNIEPNQTLRVIS